MKKKNKKLMKNKASDKKDGSKKPTTETTKRTKLPGSLSDNIVTQAETPPPPIVASKQTKIFPVGKKIIRRKPGSKPSTYFDNNTQLAIVEFQKEADIMKKNNIYLHKIFPALDSLVENLISVYGFNVMLDSRSDLKNECLEFLYSALPKFNAEKGSKAFSYFNVVAKHWLTIKSKQNTKRAQTYLSVDNKESMSQHDLETLESYQIAYDGEHLMIAEEFKAQVLRLLEGLGAKTRTANEQNCVKAILILLQNIDNIDLLNKRAILLYLREITALNSKQLSIVLASLKRYYKDLRKQEEYMF